MRFLITILDGDNLKTLIKNLMALLSELFAICTFGWISSHNSGLSQTNASMTRVPNESVKHIRLQHTDGLATFRARWGFTMARPWSAFCSCSGNRFIVVENSDRECRRLDAALNIRSQIWVCKIIQCNSRTVCCWLPYQRLDSLPCPHGYLAGSWGADASENSFARLLSNVVEPKSYNRLRRVLGKKDEKRRAKNGDSAGK